MIPDDVAMSFKLALLVPSVRTPFAVLVLLGAAVAAYGVLRLSAGGRRVTDDDRFDYEPDLKTRVFGKTHMSPEELRGALGLLDSGYALLVAGVVLAAIGMIPFAAGRS